MADNKKFNFTKINNSKLREFNHKEYKKDKNEKFVKNGDDNAQESILNNIINDFNKFFFSFFRRNCCCKNKEPSQS